MKKMALLLLASCITCLLGAQSTGKVAFDAIEKLLKTGDAPALSAYFPDTIECDLLGEEGVYSKAQAAMIVKRFFEKHVPKSFSFKHSSDKQAVKYAIGILQTQANDKYRVTIFMKMENDTAKIHQLRIEKEEI